MVLVEGSDRTRPAPFGPQVAVRLVQPSIEDWIVDPLRTAPLTHLPSVGRCDLQHFCPYPDRLGPAACTHAEERLTAARVWSRRRPYTAAYDPPGRPGPPGASSRLR